MNFPAQLAKHFRDVYFGGNWTAVNLKESLAGVSWEQATTKVHSLNTIAALVFHLNYYVDAVAGVLNGAPLEAHDRYSYDLPLIRSEQDWEALLTATWTNVENLAALIEQLPESRLATTFVADKYSNYHRNLLGLIEHAHYHLGQIVLIKKSLAERNA